MTLSEPGVALTDYGLAVECAVLAWLLTRLHRDRRGSRGWFILFFAALGVAAACGGTAHGFAHQLPDTVHALVWKLSLIAIGAASFSAWLIAGSLVLSVRRIGRLHAGAGVALAVYCVVVVVFLDTFLVAVVFYLPAAVFLLSALAVEYRRTRAPFLMAGISGLLLSFLAAGVQQAGLGPHPVWMDHNVIYHLIQAVAFLFLFRSARGIVTKGDTG